MPAGGVEFGFGEAAEPGAFVVLLRDTSGRSCHRSRDALAYPLFDGGNVGVRRPYLQALFAMPGYDPLAAADNRPQPS